MRNESSSDDDEGLSLLLFLSSIDIGMHSGRCMVSLTVVMMTVMVASWVSPLVATVGAVKSAAHCCAN